MTEILVLSIVQGITEFLPISSSAHLILISGSESITLDVSLHLGSLIAVILFFKNDILNFLKNKLLVLKIIFGSFPTLLIGFILVKFNFIESLRNINIIAFTTIFFGIVLYFSDKNNITKKIEKDFSIRDSIYIGLAQVLSLIPGVSRSGIIITAARFLKFDRIDSAKISLLLSIPTLFSISAYNILEMTNINNINISYNNFFGSIFSFIFSIITLKFFLNFLKKFTLIFFVFYRICLGLIIFIFIYL